MAESFTKLFGSLTDSTIWAEDNETRIVWITLLAMADREGYVGASVPGLAHRARVPIPATEAALAKFLAPDPYSRSQEFEGRRIEVADRGWTLLNYQRFRDMRDEDARRAYERDRKREQRHHRDSPGMSHDVPDSPTMSAQAEAEAEAEAGNSEGAAVAAPAPSVAVVKRDRKTGVRARNVEAVTAHVAGVLASVAEEGAARLRVAELRRLAGEMAFLYWQHVYGHPKSLLDEKRLAVALRRLDENSGHLDELLYAIDGAQRDEYVMGTGRCAEKGRHDAFEFILRDRSAVETHAGKMAGYRNETPHPKARKLAEAVQRAEPEPAPEAVSA